jgi:aminoglycoside phosphotransferase family enzyme/predicted kinase
MSLDMEGHRVLVQSLLKADFLNTSEKPPRLIETHISSVIVTESYVYKIKKPLNLGFLDFSTLQKRQFYCEEELRLNQRLSPDLYIDVMKVTGSVQDPLINGETEAIEYLVRMKPFLQRDQLDRLLQENNFSQHQVKALAEYIAGFHRATAVAPSQSEYGSYKAVLKPVQENFVQIRQRLKDPAQLKRLIKLETSSMQTASHLRKAIDVRKDNNFVRECHGDLHLRNLAWFEGHPLAFDCIEFDPNLYFIDVINDVAFLMMDLWYQQRHDLAQVFLNQYLQANGDYSGLQLLRFYMHYRAMVRAKIDIISVNQDDLSNDKKQALLTSFNSYLNLAEKLSQNTRPTLFIMFGPSGSGKSTVAAQLCRLNDAIVLRSDIERKRLYSVDFKQNLENDFGKGIYSSDATQKTYQRLAELSACILQAGLSVIVDATFNEPEHRALFVRLCRQQHCHFKIIELKVSQQTMRERIKKRRNDVSDADLKVLENQLSQWVPLTPEEQQNVITIDVEQAVSDEFLRKVIGTENK